MPDRTINIEQTLHPTRIERVGQLRGIAAAFPWLQVFPPGLIEWKTFDLPLAELPTSLSGLRIIHLTDFHLRRAHPMIYDPLALRIRDDPPDLMLFTGDFVDNKRDPYPALPTVHRFLDGISATCPCFAIVGNHDDYTVAYELRDSGLRFLDGRRETHEINGEMMEFIGLPGAHRLDLEPEFLRRLPAKTDGTPRIVLSHYPDHLRRAASLQADILLAGHTHGGQMCMPGRVPLMWHDTLPRRLAAGVHRVNGTWLVVSRGLGYTGLPFRVFAPPEVIELRLQRA